MVYNTSERLDSQFYEDSTNHDVIRRMDKSYMDYVTVNQAFQAEADLDTRFYAGDQALWFELYGNSPYWGQKRYYFNIIKPACEMVIGYQRQHKKSLSCSAFNPRGEHAASQMSKSLIWAYNQTNGHEVSSKAFEGAVVTGLSYINIDIGYETDPVNGDIILSSVPYNYYWVDPWYKNFDMSDAESVWRRQMLPKSQVKRMFNYQRDKEIDMLVQAYNKDGKFIFIPENYYMKDLGLYIVDEYMYMTKRKTKFLVDVRTGQTKEWTHDNEEALNDLLNTFEHLDLLETETPTVRYNIVVNGVVMYSGPHPTGLDSYPMIPVYGYYNPELSNFSLRHQGLVRGMRDPQFLYNRLLVNNLDIIESQVNSGWKYKENAVVNPEDLKRGGNGTNVKVAKNANLSDIEKIQPAQVPPSLIQLQQELKDLVYQTGQINQELMGAANDDVPGILAMVRQGAGLLQLQKLFDQLDNSQKILGDKMLEVMQKNWKEGKFTEILGEQPDPMIRNKTWTRFNIVVDEVAYTDTQKRIQFQQLMQLQQLGVQIPSKLLIENSPLVDKDQLYKAVAEKEMAASQQKQLQERLALERLALENQEIKAESKSKESLAAERLNKVGLDAALSAERIARAENDKARADLELVEAAYKLQSIDIENLKKLIDLLDSLKGRSDVEATQAATQTLSQNVKNAVKEVGEVETPSISQGQNNQAIARSEGPVTQQIGIT